MMIEPWYARDIFEVLRRGREKHPYRAIILVHGYGLVLGLAIIVVGAVNFRAMTWGVSFGFALTVLATVIHIHALAMKIREARAVGS